MSDLLKIIVLLAFLIGYPINLIRFCNANFEAPYKNEILRGIGIFVAPVGSVLGYINIKD